MLLHRKAELQHLLHGLDPYPKVFLSPSWSNIESVPHLANLSFIGPDIGLP